MSNLHLNSCPCRLLYGLRQRICGKTSGSEICQNWGDISYGPGIWPVRRQRRFCWLLCTLSLQLMLFGCTSEVPVSTAEKPLPEVELHDAVPVDKAILEGDPTKKAAGQHTNRLAGETSPYLRMHAHNPVDWYPWGEEALDAAKQENKLIFLSIGYSSCFWCHVMERESFMDEEIAQFLNEHFICIKVDREERPDIDNIYMRAVQILTGHGGWPMSMFLTPDAQPFYGGTYYPARDDDRPRVQGFLTIIRVLQDAWTKDGESLNRDAAQLTQIVKTSVKGAPALPVQLDQEQPQAILEELSRRFDDEYGGFYDPQHPVAPKFPEPSNLLFLIDVVDRQQDERAGNMLQQTLDQMAQGGIRDHLGGGFHRYSTDRFWHIPHFEKMLSDNGQLATVYAEAYRLTNRQDYRDVVVELLGYVEREMTDEEGGFYAAIDAETDREEGKFYRWDKSEMQELVGDAHWEEFALLFGINGPPNFEREYYVPQLTVPLQDLNDDQRQWLAEQFPAMRNRLREARGRRKRPLTDNKILTGWNSLMIRGYADAGRLLDEPQYVKAAERAADFVLASLRTSDGRLLRTYSEGEARLNAYLTDYAFLVDALIALFHATGQRQWLETAGELTAKQIDLYWDDDLGGFFFTSNDHESLIVRFKNHADGAQPSGNSVAAHNLVRLGVLLDKPDYFQLADRTIKSTASLLRNSPTAVPRLGVAIAELLALQQSDSEEPAE